MKNVYLTRILWLMIFVLLNQNLYSQNAKEVDSLLTILKTTPPDTSHVDIYLQLYLRFSRADIDSAVGYAQMAKALADELDFQIGLAKSTHRLGVAYTNLENFTLAEKEFMQSLEVAGSADFDAGKANAYSGLGKIYYQKNEFDRATSFYVKALELLESTGDRNSEARVMNDLGTLYRMQRQHDKALSYYHGALNIVRQLNFEPGISSCLLNISGVYIDEKEFDKALPYLEESLAIKKEIGDKIGESRALNNMGNIHRELKRHDQANADYTRALALAEEVNNPGDIVAVIFNLALNEFQRGDYNKSLVYGERSLKQSKIDKNLEMEIRSHGVLADNYAALGQMDKAYKLTTLINALKDSLFDEKIVSLGAELEAKYQSEKKEREINALSSENELNAQQLLKSRIERNYLIALTILALLLGVVMWSRYRIKQKSNEVLKELDQTKSRFFANISHEFRTPLTLIAGNLDDLVAEASENGDDQARLSIMQKNTKRLRQLIDQLLDLSKLESGKLQLHVAHSNLANFLRAITSSFSSWAGQKSIQLTVNIPDETLEAYIDEDIVEKIINNLLSNAIKFSPQNGAVTLSAQWNEDNLEILVSDNGPGISKEKIDHIFDRFYQVDDSTTRNQEGSGIGLALVKELVALHHGKISVESKPGVGTSFVLKVPILKKHYKASEISSDQRTLSNSAKSGGSEHVSAVKYPEFTEQEVVNPIILVVEDNIDLGHYIGDHLPDCSVILASNGIDGFNKAIQHIPDLIISDVMMPEMDGVDMCKKIKKEEKTSHIPVILLTAKADIESRLEGLETGADDYMTKPFDARELQTRVRNLIIQREKLRKRFSKTVILKPRDIAITSPDETFLEKVMAIIEDHLSDSEFKVDDFQKEIGMSRMQLHRKLKALTGHSPGEFVRIQRLVRASEMLSKGFSSVSEVCYQTGFGGLSYFDKCFKKQFGVTPKEYVTSHTQIQ